MNKLFIIVVLLICATTVKAEESTLNSYLNGKLWNNLDKYDKTLFASGAFFGVEQIEYLVPFIEAGVNVGRMVYLIDLQYLDKDKSEVYIADAVKDLSNTMRELNIENAKKRVIDKYPELYSNDKIKNLLNVTVKSLAAQPQYARETARQIVMLAHETITRLDEMNANPGKYQFTPTARQ